MEIIILAIIGGLAGLAWDQWRRKRVAVRWGQGTKVRLLPQEALAASIRSFEQRGFKVFPGVEGTVGAGFSRGNWSLPRVSGASCTDWQEVPVVVGLGITGTDESSKVHVIFMSPPGIPFSPAAARFFIEQASGEFKRLVACLEASARNAEEQQEAPSSEKRRGRHRWYPEDDGGASQRVPTLDASHDADLALLGLERGAGEVELRDDAEAPQVRRGQAGARERLEQSPGQGVPAAARRDACEFLEPPGEPGMCHRVLETRARAMADLCFEFEQGGDIVASLGWRIKPGELPG